MRLNEKLAAIGPEVFRLLDELIEGQKRKLLHCARRIIPHVTPDDLLQPNDFPELEHHPYFRYEEGILDGLQVARAALLALEKDQEASLRGRLDG